ncbi:MAG: DMT family transporter [Thaumarchaeota archaeon]|nr:DMT family transporter [Nitrososphaerota archaeon]
MAGEVFNPVYALVAALLWAFSPIYYRSFLQRFDFLNLNLLRTGTASAVLLVPALYYGFGAGVLPALLSGAATLACGDSLFLLSIRETGASVAAPVVYTYVLLVQFTAVAVGEAVPGTNFVAAAMVVAGVFVLSRGGRGKPRARGIAFALAGAVAWTVGQDLIKVATVAGGDFVVVTFCRNAAAAAALGVAVLATGRARRWPTGVTPRELGFMALIILSDLVLGSLLFVYSISTIGVAVTVVLTSLSPLLTQIFSRALGKEAPSRQDFGGGALIVAALVLAVVL